jgi:hypothetical protein
LVRLSEQELARLDALGHGESRPACLRRLLRESPIGEQPGTPEPSASEALALLAAQARDGRTAAVVAYARILCSQEPDITARRVDQLIREARHAN